MFGPFAKKDDRTRAEEARQREMTHAERLKALELGRPLPEVELARAQTETTRARAEAAKVIVGVIVRGLVGLGTLGIAVAATAVVLVKGSADTQVTALAIIWTAATIVGVATALAGVLDGRRLNLRGLLPERPSQSASPDEERLFSAIQK
jgi:membrane glycosyltransferase